MAKTVIYRCTGCGGILDYYRQYCTYADHHPSCDGSCEFCPEERLCGEYEEIELEVE